MRKLDEVWDLYQRQRVASLAALLGEELYYHKGDFFRSAHISTDPRPGHGAYLVCRFGVYWVDEWRSTDPERALARLLTHMPMPE